MKFLEPYTARLKKLLSPSSWYQQSYIRYMESLPVDDNLILLESEHGKKINGNIFYILRSLTSKEEYRNYKLYVSCKKDSRKQITELLNTHNIQNVHLCKYTSFEYFKILATAKYLINDTSFGPYFLKRPEQVYLNTWHGTPFKAMGRQTEKEKSSIGNVQKNFVVSDYLLFPNKHTQTVITRDYMLDNLYSAESVFCGYPRNTIFFDTDRQQQILSEINPEHRKLYAYMPTFRGAVNVGQKKSNNDYLQQCMLQLDELLTDDEVFYVNIHPLAKSSLTFDQYKHIRCFPPQYETYEVLSVCDCLVTDYSSVFFDYASCRRKIVLFTYDYEEYLSDRGTYVSLDYFPFPKVYDVPQLMEELRSPKQYDDSAFLREFAAYDSIDATEKLLNLLLFGRRDSLLIEAPANNGKENVLICSGTLRRNGITSALGNLLRLIDTSKRNYYITFRYNELPDQNTWLAALPPGINYIPTIGDLNFTKRERLYRFLFKRNHMSTKKYVSRCERHIKLDQKRLYGNATFGTVIDFNGYEKESTIFLSLFDSKRILYTHSNMLSEQKTRSTQRRDMLEYAYRTFDQIAVVGPGLVEPTATLTGDPSKISVCRTPLDYATIQKKASLAVSLDKETCVFPDRKALTAALTSPFRRYISVGRFSPEKGHARLIGAFSRYAREHSDCYLIIMGGNAWRKEFEKTIRLIKKLNLSERVILVLDVSNPYPIMKQCDAFVLSSFYEGFGLVIPEAAIVGLPVVSTDIDGPKQFMRVYGGLLVDNSEDGLFRGFCSLGNNEVSPMDINFDEYNQTAVNEFETMLSKPL